MILLKEGLSGRKGFSSIILSLDEIPSYVVYTSNAFSAYQTYRSVLLGTVNCNLFRFTFDEYSIDFSECSSRTLSICFWSQQHSYPIIIACLAFESSPKVDGISNNGIVKPLFGSHVSNDASACVDTNPNINPRQTLFFKLLYKFISCITYLQ